MKKTLLLLLIIPVWGFAQTATKYLAGAVPVVDGKVTFAQTINVPGVSQAELYQMVDRWANEQFMENDKFPNNKIISEKPDEGAIGAIGEENIVFSANIFSLDRSRIYYQFVVQCEEEKCNLTMTKIRYWYNEARDGGERYNAEQIITDENGLSKDRTKLARVIGKFRSATIDYKDNLFKSVATSITEQLQEAAMTEQEKAQSAVVGTPSVVTINTAQPVTSAPVVTAAAEPVVETVVAQTEETSPMAGFRQIDATAIPGNICQLLSEEWMLITAGDESRFNMMTASWGGLGNLYSGAVAFCFINPARYTYRLMEKSDTYTLSFYKEEYRDALKLCGTTSGRDTDKVEKSGLTPITTPSGSKAFREAWLIIECRKLVAQSLNPEALQSETLKKEWEGKSMHKMYIGRILNVWMK